MTIERPCPCGDDEGSDMCPDCFNVGCRPGEQCLWFGERGVFGGTEEEWTAGRHVSTENTLLALRDILPNAGHINDN